MGALVRSKRQAVQPMEQAVAQGRQYLIFTVAGETFGIAISSIKEIIEYRAPTDVPMMPAFMRGVINLRGRVVPVIDLSARFGRAKGQNTRRTCIVILDAEQQEERQDIGLVVDAVSAVLEIADADIEPAPSFGAKLRSEFIGGMGKVGEEFVIILDTDRVLSVQDLAGLGGAHRAGESASRTLDAPAPEQPHGKHAARADAL